MKRDATNVLPHPPAPSPALGEEEPESVKVSFPLWERDLELGQWGKLHIAL
ncbi:hypothetical protein [Pseudanabaena sp. PCC 6802]|uniref:hypothetical protein n=1 Tax=Pseudanabaena sp. PCC 6802 TaxID=118173 RepID=UPI0003471D82|nr:hypothetical protein [Pseudanabaena sp. PCC 6802]